MLFAQWVLDVNDVSDVVVNSITVMATPNATADVQHITSVALYDSETGEKLSDSRVIQVVAGQSGDVTFSGLKLKVEAGKSKEVQLRGDLSLAATANGTFNLVSKQQLR